MGKRKQQDTEPINLRQCFIEKDPAYAKDLSVEQWRMIDAGEKYGRGRYNDALDDIQLYLNAGHVITAETLKHLRKPIQ